MGSFINPLKHGKYTRYVILVQSVKAYRRGRGLAPLTLNLVARWRWVVNITPRPLYPWEGIPMPIEREAGRVPGSVWTLWKRE
jgi:hypothetical protein